MKLFPSIILLLLFLTIGCRDDEDSSTGTFVPQPPSTPTMENPAPSPAPTDPQVDHLRQQEEMKPLRANIQNTLKDLEEKGIHWGADWSPLPLKLIEHKLALRTQREHYNWPETYQLFVQLRKDLEELFNQYEQILSLQDKAHLKLLLSQLQQGVSQIFYEQGLILYEYCQRPFHSNSPGIQRTLEALKKAIDQPYIYCDTLEEETRKARYLILSRINGPLDLRPLMSLRHSQLRHLEIASNDENGSIEPLDLSPLSQLVQLEHLEIRNFNVKDISPLQNLTRLRGLNLAENQIADLSPLANLTQLEHIVLRRNKVQSTLAFMQLMKLQSLDLSSNSLISLVGVGQLKRLTSLDLSNNQLPSVNQLSELFQLEYLDVHNNFIQSFLPLSDLYRLKTFIGDKNPLYPQTEHCPLQARAKPLEHFCKKTRF